MFIKSFQTFTAQCAKSLFAQWENVAERELWVFMELRPAVLWTCLLGAGLALGNTQDPPNPPTPP